MKNESQRQREGQQVSQRLGLLNPGQAAEAGQDQQRRNKEESAPGGAQEGRPDLVPRALIQHLRTHAERQEKNRRHLQAQGPGTDFNHPGIIPEHADQIIGKNETHTGRNQDHRFAHDQCHPVGFSKPAVFTGAEVEGAYRLESLPDSQRQRKHEEGNSSDDAHGRDGFIPEGRCRAVQQNGRDAVEYLPQHARQSGGYDISNLCRSGIHVFRGKMHLRPAPQEHAQQNEKADNLAGRSGNCRAGNPHIQCEHQQRVQGDIQDRSGHQADHTQ